MSESAFSVPGGMAADRFGARIVILLGWGTYALVYVGFAAAAESWHVWLLFAGYGLFFGLTEAPERRLVASFAGAGTRARAYGWFHAAVGAAALPASLLFGWIWQTRSAEAALLTAAALALVATLMLGVLVREPRTVS